MRHTDRVRYLRLVLISLLAGGLFALNVPAASATNDQYWSRQYGPKQIGADTAWQKSTGKNVKVAVIDSGVDVDHPDLKPNLVPQSEWRDFACNDNNPDDDSQIKDSSGTAVKGHGTHVAGTIAAAANNSIGVAGVAPDAKILPLKVYKTTDACQGSSGGLFQTQITSAIDYAVADGAKVINLSLIEIVPGIFGALVQTIEQRCRAAYSKGTLCVIAAGNNGASQASGYPADIPALIVTANDSDGRHASFGQRPDTMWGISAPGVAIASTWPLDDNAHNGYNEIQGTSMAAPHAAGAAAILFGAGLSAKQVAEKLVATAGPARDTITEGAGIIHVERALGLESAPADVPGNTATTLSRTVARNNAGGGASAAPTTTSTTSFELSEERGDFESGISTDDGEENFNDLRLKEASRNSANKPFNAAKPLIGLSIVALVVLLAVAIPRIRSKDALPPH